MTNVGTRSTPRPRATKFRRSLLLIVAVILQAITGAAAFISGLVLHPAVWYLLLAGWLVAGVLMIRRWKQAVKVLGIAVAYAAALPLSLFAADIAGLTGT